MFVESSTLDKISFNTALDTNALFYVFPSLGVYSEFDKFVTVKLAT